jgi:hypothetical protein
MNSTQLVSRTTEHATTRAAASADILNSVACWLTATAAVHPQSSYTAYDLMNLYRLMQLERATSSAKLAMPIYCADATPSTWR